MDHNSFSTSKKVLLFIVVAPLFIFGFGYIVMLLWNALLPEIIGVNTITYWQAIGILILSKILFGGFGGKGKSHHNHSNNSKHNLRQKWMNMDEDERAKFKEQWKNSCTKERE